MVLFLKLVDETQISTTLESTRHYNSTKLLILLLSEPFSFDHFNMIHPVLDLNIANLFLSNIFLKRSGGACGTERLR